MNDEITSPSQEPQTPNWNAQLKQWCESQGKRLSDIAKEIGMPRQSLHNYAEGVSTEIDRISGERRMQLYAATGIEAFKVEGGYTPKPTLIPGNRKGKKRTQRIVDTSRAHGRIEDTSRTYEKVDPSVVRDGLTGIQKLEAGLLQFQQYRPSPEKRAEAVLELIDVLAEEVDYYRSASAEERRVLVERLKQNPESFGYATQILNVLYQGKQIDSWMMMAQPPSKIRRIRGERK